MNIPEIKSELNRITNSIRPHLKAIEKLSAQRSAMIKEWQERCRHSNVEQYEHYTSDDWDRTSETSQKRKCMACGLVERGKESADGDFIVFDILKHRPPSMLRFHGKEGRSYYFSPSKRQSISERYTFI